MVGLDRRTSYEVYDVCADSCICCCSRPALVVLGGAIRQRNVLELPKTSQSTVAALLLKLFDLGSSIRRIDKLHKQWRAGGIRGIGISIIVSSFHLQRWNKSGLPAMQYKRVRTLTIIQSTTNTSNMMQISMPYNTHSQRIESTLTTMT